MGEKVTFNSVTKIITIDEAPDGNGDVIINVRQDLYSDGKEDWVSTESLRRVQFPITAVGGNPTPGDKALGSTFFLKSDWKIQPYDANHRLIIEGNLYADDGSDFILTVTGKTVKVVQTVSLLTEAILTGGSAITQDDIDDIADAVWTHSTADFLLKVIKNKKALVKTGLVWQLIIYDDDDTTPILTKDLKDPDGNNISDFEAGVLTVELKTSV